MFYHFNLSMSSYSALHAVKHNKRIIYHMCCQTALYINTLRRPLQWSMHLSDWRAVYRFTLAKHGAWCHADAEISGCDHCWCWYCAALTATATAAAANTATLSTIEHQSFWPEQRDVRVWQPSPKGIRSLNVECWLLVNCEYLEK